MSHRYYHTLGALKDEWVPSDFSPEEAASPRDMPAGCRCVYKVAIM